MVKNIISQLLVTVLFSVCVFAQGEGQIQDQCDLETAQFIVAQQVSESGTVTDRLKKIKILTVSADFMWDFDEPKAREYFTDAYKNAFEYFREKGLEREKLANDNRIMGAVIDPRLDVIKVIARHDSEWARELTNKLLAEFEEAAKNRKDSELTHEVSFLLSLANETLESNPDLSWYLFRLVMKYPADSHWYFALYSTAAKKPDVAAALYAELLNNYANGSTRELLLFSAFPFRTDRVFGPDRYSMSMGTAPSYDPSPVLQANFLDLFFNKIMNAMPDQFSGPLPQTWLPPEPVYMYMGITDLEPYVIQFQPSLVPRMQAAKSRALSLITDPMNPKLEEFQKRAEGQSKSFEEKIRELEELDKEGKLEDYHIILVAVSIRLTEPQFRMLEPWIGKIKEETPRKDTFDHFWFSRSKLASEEERFAEADTYAARVNVLEFQALLSFYTVQAKLKKEEDPANIYQLLAHVSRIAQRMPDNPTKVRVLLGLTHLYKDINRGFAINELASAVQVINRLNEPNLSTNSIMRVIKGEKVVSMASYPLPGHNLEGTFREISKDDSDLPLSNARGINDNYLRTLAVIAIAKNCAERSLETGRNAENNDLEF